MDSRYLFKNRYSEVDGVESIGRRELMNPPSTNTRYLETLYNLEELEQDVHRLVTVLGMVDMQSQDN